MRGTEMKGIEMKGIERLRDWVGTLRLSGLVWAEEMADELESTVDLIKREHAEDCCKMGLDYGSVSRVASEMERHVSGVEGMEDSPVARWARELREALTSNEGEKVKCCPADDVSMSSYDLLPQEERDAIAWVREHGGIEALRRMFQDADNRRVELCAALGIDLDKGWSEAMAAMHLRLMPEGMEWPRFEDGEPLRVGDEVCGGGRAFIVDHVVLFSNGESTVCAEADMDSGKVRDYARVRPSYRLKRPAPKVLDADGAEIREKCDVWWICEGDERGVHAERLRVETIGPNGLIECSPYNGGTWVHLEPSELYVNKPVLSADGRPLREGEKVSNDRGDRFTVVKVDHERGIFSARNERTGTVAIGLSSARFTHERPDSYQRLYMDMAGQGQGNSIGFGEFVRRAQELAEHPPMREERRDGR